MERKKETWIISRIGIPVAYACLGKELGTDWLIQCHEDRSEMIRQQKDIENPKGLILFDSIKVTQLLWGQTETVFDKLFYWLKGLIPFSGS